MSQQVYVVPVVETYIVSPVPFPMEVLEPVRPTSPVPQYSGLRLGDRVSYTGPKNTITCKVSGFTKDRKRVYLVGCGGKVRFWTWADNSRIRRL